MKKLNLALITTFTLALSAQAATIAFTNVDGAGATVDFGTLTAPTPPVADFTVTSLSYTVSGLTIDNDGTLNDTVTFTMAIAGGSNNILWDVSSGEFDAGGGTFNTASELMDFGAITVSGTGSGGDGYVLNSAVYTQITNRRWSTSPTAQDSSTIAGDVTNIANNFDASVTLNDTAFSQTWIATDGITGTGYNVDSFAFTVDVVAVPEPSTYALLGGFFALAFVMVRRRK